MEITTESPLLPWLVRQCDVASEVRQMRTVPDSVLWRDEAGGLLEPGQQERKERSTSSREGHARGHAHEFPKLVQLPRASQSC